jgi:hypothetical protein
MSICIIFKDYRLNQFLRLKFAPYKNAPAYESACALSAKRNIFEKLSRDENGEENLLRKNCQKHQHQEARKSGMEENQKAINKIDQEQPIFHLFRPIIIPSG